MANLQLARNLRFLRKKNHLNQEDLANMLSISRQAYCNYENSSRTPDIENLVILAAHFHISLDQLILHDLEDEALLDSSSFSSAIHETPTPYLHAQTGTLTESSISTDTFLASHAKGIEKNTGNYIYLSSEELDTVLTLRSTSPETRQIVTGFLNNSSHR